MKKIMVFLLLLLFLTGCQPLLLKTPDLSPDTTLDTDSDEETLHYYLDGVSLADVLVYFNETCLDSEYSSGDGDSSLIQKWEAPIYYQVYGTPTKQDLRAIHSIAKQLNKIEGFPGFFPADDDDSSLEIYFCSAEELVERMGDDFSLTDYGACTFWYDDHVINRGIICYRDDIPQRERISVIKEEIYNLTGPIQDTILRSDSIIYQHSNENLSLSQIDLLLLQLLYHPNIKCGMDYEACSDVITDIYRD